jgi:hypothetical protein
VSRRLRRRCRCRRPSSRVVSPPLPLSPLSSLAAAAAAAASFPAGSEVVAAAVRRRCRLCLVASPPLSVVVVVGVCVVGRCRRRCLAIIIMLSAVCFHYEQCHLIYRPIIPLPLPLPPASCSFSPLLCSRPRHHATALLVSSAPALPRSLWRGGPPSGPPHREHGLPGHTR